MPPPRFDAVRFETYRPAPDEPSQQAAVTALTGVRRADRHAAAQGAVPQVRRRRPAAYYLDGGFGVGKTHLLASLWHAVPGPKAYGTFVEYTHLVGALGFDETVRRLSGHRLLAVDEFELDDPGDTMLMTRLLGQLSDAGVHLAATSNTLPDKLGEGRFAAEDFRREIHALSARFDTLRVDGPDYRHAGLAAGAAADVRRRTGRGRARSTAGGQPGLVRRPDRASSPGCIRPSTAGWSTASAPCTCADVQPLADQASALRWVVLIDRIYDRSIPVRASGAPLDEIFTPEMLSGGYRKKYLRATSRILALARDAAASDPRPMAVRPASVSGRPGRRRECRRRGRSRRG